MCFDLRGRCIRASFIRSKLGYWKSGTDVIKHRGQPLTARKASSSLVHEWVVNTGNMVLQALHVDIHGVGRSLTS